MSYASFQGIGWPGVQVLLRKSARMLRDCRVLNKPEDAEKLEAWAGEMERRSMLPPRLSWEPSLNQGQELQSSFGVSVRSQRLAIGQDCDNAPDAVLMPVKMVVWNVFDNL
jgi:hypothetical protein